MNDARRAVVTALMKQEHDGYANLVLHAVLRDFDGAERDRAFVSAAFYGAVERQITLDFLLQKFIAKPLARLDAEVRAVLRAGLYQARYMDGVPVSAAVNESVSLVRRMGKSSAAGMVNAVLRKAAAVDLQAEKFASETQRLCVEYSVSPQIARLLQSALPQECEAILQASFRRNALCVRVNTLKTTADELAAAFEKQGVRTWRGDVPNALYLDYKGDITRNELFIQGLLHVQGEGSQLACAALAPKPGETVLDVCAAPGGKSVTLAQYLCNKGVLTSCDAAQNRLSLIETAFVRMDVRCARVLHNDAAVYNETLNNANAVLCDVPCSGLGVLAQKPDIRHKNLDGLDALVRLQRKILQTASRYVAPGGRLVYSTCTLNPAENEAAAADFLAHHPDFIVKTPDCLPKGARVQQGFVTLHPFETQTDGFFVALFIKRI